MTNEPLKDLTLLDRLKLYPENELGSTIEKRKSELQELLEIVKKGRSKSGKELEKLAQLLLESPYLKFNKARRRCESGEIDLDFTVKCFEGTLFHEFSYLLIVECKDWKKETPGAAELRIFCSKMDEVDSSVGIFFSTNGVTRDANRVIRDSWKKYKLVVIVFDAKDLEKIINGDENLYESLNKKYLAVRSASNE